MCTNLISKGLSQQKTKLLDGTIFTHVSENLARHFVRGYFDGDGCISKINVAEYRISVCGTEAFLTRLAGLLPVVSTIHSKPGVYTLQFSGTARVDQFKKWLYEDASIFLERKKYIFDAVPRFRGSSKYKGVYYIKARNHWVARVYECKKMRNLGHFTTEDEANTCRIEYDALSTSVGCPI